MDMFKKLMTDETKEFKMVSSPHSYDWDINSLLTCLSGAILPNGRIIIATCNNLETIRKICPELIREGRMTPIECPYGDYDDLVAIAKDYGVTIDQSDTKLQFRQSAVIEFLETQPSPTAEMIIEYAMKSAATI